MSLLLPIGLAAIAWAAYSVITGKGHYKGCPPGGFDRELHPFSFWVPTLIIFGIGVFAVLVSIGLIPVHPRQ